MVRDKVPCYLCPRVNQHLMLYAILCADLLDDTLKVVFSLGDISIEVRSAEALLQVSECLLSGVEPEPL